MTNVRHQIKSKFYYIFWGICTVTVFVGQLNVATGYAQMTDAVIKLTTTLDNESFERTLPIQIRGGNLGPGY